MRILHLSLGLPPFRTGGLNRYCADLISQQIQDGHEIILLYPGEFSFLPQVRIKRQRHKQIQLYKIINPLPLPLTNGISDPKRYMKECSSKVYEAFLDEVKPDVIHIHTLQGFHKELFEEAKKFNIRMVYTTHDYYPFCPKCIMLDNYGNQCDGNCPEKCVECNKGSGLSKKQEYVMQSVIYAKLKYTFLLKKIRQHQRSINGERTKKTIQSNTTSGEYQQLLNYYYQIMKCVDLIHANSWISFSIYKKVFPDFKYRMIPITHAGLQCHTLKNNKADSLDISFLGGMDSFKGIDILLKALKIVDQKGVSNWNLWLYGADFSEICNDKRIHNMGRFTKDQEEKVWNHSNHLLVVPSKCMETFSFVVLEGLANGASVICSDLVGAQLYLPPENIVKHNDAEALAIAIQNYNCNVKVDEKDISIKEHSKLIIEEIYSI